MGRFSSMVVVFLVALVLTTTPAKAIDCMSALSNLFPCSTFLKNPNHALPDPSCCNAAANWIGFGDDVDSFCKCFRPMASHFLPSKAQQLPGLCSLDAAFLPLVKCLAPPFDALLPPLPFSPLPPLPVIPPSENLQDGLVGALPPLPFVPLPSIPSGPLPPFGPLPPESFDPLPFGPLPPLPFLPPADYQ